MPYVSDRQRRYMHWAAAHGKISPKVVKEFDEASRGMKSERAKSAMMNELPPGAKQPSRNPEDGEQADPAPLLDDIQKSASAVMFRAAADELASIVS